MSDPLRSIYTAIEFIENHLKEDITVADIAAAAGYSLYHFIRTFNQVVRHTPYDYLIRRRLTEAARDLVDSDSRILDISLEYRFKNHETFSRAFKRMFGIPPGQWRERGFIHHHFQMPKLSLAYLSYISQEESLRAELVERDEITLLGLMSQDRKYLPRLWTSLEQALIEFQLPEAPRSFYRVSSQLQNLARSSFYFVGVETSHPESHPPPWVTQTLPQGKYARFSHQGPSAQLPLLMAYVQHTWLPQSDYRLAHPIEIVCCESIQGHGSDSDRDIYIPVEALT